MSDKKSAEDLAQVLTDMRFDREAQEHDSYPVVNIEVMVEGICHMLDVEEYYYDTESNLIVIKATDGYL